MDRKILITLTSEESKRLIAKYVVTLPLVKRAMEKGIIDIQMSSTGGYIYEELSGRPINKAAHLCGCITAGGGCQAYLPEGIKREAYFEKGVVKHISFPFGDFSALLNRMGPGDIIIKSGNLLDRKGKAWTFVGEPSGDGGEWGLALEYVKKSRIDVVVPMTLNKSAHIDGEEAAKLFHIHELDWDRTHMIAELMPIPGMVLTEIEAIKGLWGVDCTVAAMNGVSSGDGTVTLCVWGQAEKVERCWEQITAIKGEPKLEIEPRCGVCLAIEDHGKCVAQKRNFTRG